MKENQRVEWKESWRDDCLKWISGFANGEGGMLVIGRNDAGGVVGVKDARKLLADLPNKIRDALGIIVDVRLKKSRSREYLKIKTPAYSNPISYHGEFYYRTGSTNQALKGASLVRFLLRKQGRTWDSVPMPRVGLRQLSRTAFATFRKLARQGLRNDATLQREPIPSLLDKLNLLEGKLLKRAAVLLFHAEPERFVTGACAFFRAGQVETWGRGIQRIFEACEAQGSPRPVIRCEARDIWIDFPFAPEHLAAVGDRPTGDAPGAGTKEKTKEKTKENIGRKTKEKTGDKLQRCMREHPTASTAELAESLGLSRMGIEWQIRRLKRLGLVIRVGPDKGGHWDVFPFSGTTTPETRDRRVPK